MKYPEAQKALNKAKMSLMENKKAIFFSTLCLSLKHEWDESIPTACVDGVTIKYNPDFFMRQPEEERVGLMLHEVMHPALQHLSRRGDRDPKKFNYAADYAANAIILAAGFKLPEGALYDAEFEGMTAEQIFDLIPDPPDATADAYCDIVYNSNAEERKEVEEYMEAALVRAAMEAQKANQAGSIPGQLQFHLKKLLDSKLPWNKIVQNLLNTIVKEGYSMTKPNRRFMPDFYLPSRWSEQFGEAAVFSDTSGSVTDHQHGIFVSETFAMLKNLRPKTIQYGQFDTDVKSVYPIHSARELLRVPFVGRGGTEINPVMEWAKKAKPEVLIVFSDGYFTPATIRPKCPVIWLIFNNKDFTAPFGKVVHFDVDKYPQG